MDSMEHDERKKGVNPGQELLQDREPAAGPRSSRRRRPPGRNRGRISHDGSRAAGRRDQRHAGGAQVRERRRHDADVTAPRPNVVLSVGQRVKYVGRVQKYRYRVGVVEHVLGDNEYLVNIQHDLIWTFGSCLEPTDEPIFYK